MGLFSFVAKQFVDVIENKNPYSESGIKLNRSELNPPKTVTPMDRIAEIEKMLKEPTDIKVYNALKQEQRQLKMQMESKAPNPLNRG